MPEKKFDQEDPMEMIGIVIPGESTTTDDMALVFIEEFIRMGWSEKKLLGLFTNSMYMATYRIYMEKGEKYVKNLIRENVEKYRPLYEQDSVTAPNNNAEESDTEINKE